MGRVWFAIPVLALCTHVILGHICLLEPRQRGPLDISTAGSHTCFRHTPPCGGQPVEMPRVVYTAGQMAFIHWQQNFNHYEPGYPGYMDVSIAGSPNSTQFDTLAVVSDRYVFAQWHQQNFSVLVRLPDVSCDHCVIRVRYNAHKPGETPFLQCSDIKIASSAAFENVDTKLKYNPAKHLKQIKNKRILPLKRAFRLHKTAMNTYKPDQSNMAPSLHGFAFNPFDPMHSQYILVDTITGKVANVGAALGFGVDSLDENFAINPIGNYMLDEVVSVDYAKGMANLILHTNGSRDMTPGSLISVGLNDGKPGQSMTVVPSTDAAINAMTWQAPGMRTSFVIQPAETPGSFYFETGTLDDMGKYTMGPRIPKPENLYINFQWLETDARNPKRVYALLGNENAPQALNARIYTFDLMQKKYMGMVELDVNNYTFMSIHSHPTSAKLFAFSPGLWTDEDYEWSLVAIDPTTGKVTKQCHIAPKGIFGRYYGGSVHTGEPTGSVGDAMLYHVLRVADSEADMIVGVNPITCKLTFSEPTNMRHVHSLVRGQM